MIVETCLQFYDFGSQINLFCQTRNYEQQVLHREYSLQYVGVPYRKHICRVRRADCSTKHRYPHGNKMYPPLSFLLMQSSWKHLGLLVMLWHINNLRFAK